VAWFSAVGYELRQFLWISLNRGISAEFAPLLIKLLSHHLSSNPGRREQVAAIPVLERNLSIHDATSL
jgi:hypothetical protein